MLRVTGSVGRLEGESGITLLGLPPATLPQLHGWRDSDAPASRQELARRIDAAQAAEWRAAAARAEAAPRSAPRATRSVSSPRSRRPNGRFVRVESNGLIPPEARGGRLAGIAIEPNTRLVERGADAGKALTGSVEIALPDVPGALDGWIGVGGARLDGSKVDYTLTNTVATRIRPRQPYDDGPVPVLVTPRLAAAADSERRAPAADRGRARLGAGRRDGAAIPRRRRSGGGR